MAEERIPAMNTTTAHTPASRLRPHREFHDLAVDDPLTVWCPAPASQGCIEYITLCDNLDAATRSGSRTRLSRWSPGASIDQAVVHDFHEEVLLLRGCLEVGTGQAGRAWERFEAYTYACRPPGVWHGPFRAPQGCLMLEFYYYT
jgi:hypothetical protein